MPIVLCGAAMEPLHLELADLQLREKKRISADTSGIFERIYKGSMPAIAGGQKSNSRIFYSSMWA